MEHGHSILPFCFNAKPFIYAVSTNEKMYAVLEDNTIDAISKKHPDHPRITFVTITPPQNFAPFLSQISGNWTTARTQGGKGAATSGGAAHSANLLIDGFVFSVGKDWLVRTANVTQSGGALKGCVIEAEYLPVEESPSRASKGGSAIINEFLSSVIGGSNIDQQQITPVTVTSQQWKEALAGQDGDDGEIDTAEIGAPEAKSDDDIFFSPDQKSGYTMSPGQSREQRSAFLIIRCLKNEGLL